MTMWNLPSLPFITDGAQTPAPFEVALVQASFVGQFNSR
jgi:hypothetical protein